MMCGDLTGKAIVPIVKLDQNLYVTNFFGVDYRMKEDELPKLQSEILLSQLHNGLVRCELANPLSPGECLDRFAFSTTSKKWPFGLTTIVTGLTLGTAIWIDLSLAAITGGTANLNSEIVVTEI
jgi:hypothetical protein